MVLEIVGQRVFDDFIEAMILAAIPESVTPVLVLLEFASRNDGSAPVFERKCCHLLPAVCHRALRLFLRASQFDAHKSFAEIEVALWIWNLNAGFT